MIHFYSSHVQSPLGLRRQQGKYYTEFNIKCVMGGLQNLEPFVALQKRLPLFAPSFDTLWYFARPSSNELFRPLPGFLLNAHFLKIVAQQLEFVY